MSYITPPYEDVSSRRGITDEQEDMIRFTANSPMRMLLYNHCLGTELCSDLPEDQGDAGEEEGGPAPEPVPFCCTGTSIGIYVAVGGGLMAVAATLAIKRRKR